MKSLLPSQPSTTMTSPAPLPHTHAQAHAHEDNLAPLLTAWDLSHPTPTDPDWRHLLDEIAHPDTTRAFHHLAATAA